MMALLFFRLQRLVDRVAHGQHHQRERNAGRNRSALQRRQATPEQQAAFKVAFAENVGENKG